MPTMLYSQGFNFTSFIHEGVDPRTGQYTSTISLYEAAAQARNCPPFKLCASFNPLDLGNIGFGRGWSLNLSSFQHDSKTLFLSTGEHYKVIQEAGQLVVKDRKLKSFYFTDNGTDFQVIHKSGLVETLSDNHGTSDTSVTTNIRAANGRSLDLVWDFSGSQPQISRIKEGSQVLLEISYGSTGEVKVIHAPGTDESTFTTVQVNGLLEEFWMPVEDTPWRFSYEAIGPITCLTEIRSPAGLVEQVQYNKTGHQLPDEAPYKAIPYVVAHTITPGNQQSSIRTTYTYSEKNFLGYRGVSNWNHGEDNLYLSGDDYEYTSTVDVEDGPSTEYTYNKFHLLVNTLQRGRTRSKQVQQRTTYFMKPNVSFPWQPAQYQLPQYITTIYRDTAVRRPPRIETRSYSFDEWGNPTSETQANGIKTDRDYYNPAGEKDPSTGEVLCPADPYGFKRHQKIENVTPSQKEGFLPAPTRSKRYKYLGLSTTMGISQFVLVRQLQTLENNQSLSSTDYIYVNQPASRDHGRLQQQITRLSGEYPTTHSWTYEYPSANQYHETTKITYFDKHLVQTETRYSLLSGLTLAQTDNGATQQFEYDKVGRLIKERVSPNTPYETTRRHEYAIAEGGIGYCLTVTDAKRVRTRYFTDSLRRIRCVEIQDDDGQQNGGNAYSGTFRVVQERSYNKLGQCEEIVDVDWLRTENQPTGLSTTQRLEFDDWGQVCKVTDSSGAVTLSATDPIDLSRTEGIEGEGTTKTYLNLFGVPAQKMLLRRDGKCYMKIDYAYDGLCRLIEQTNNLGHTTQYEVDSFDRVIKTTWPNGHSTDTQYAPQSTATLPESINVNGHTVGKQSFDGLGRATRRTVGARTTTRWYEGSAPKPFKIKTPKGIEHNLTYQPALDYVLTSFDHDTYDYDKESAAITELKGRCTTEKRHYLPSGLLRQQDFNLNQKKYSTHSTYSMAGRLQSYTDAHGQKHIIQYDVHGRPEQLVQGKIKVMFVYDKLSRLCETHVQDKEQSQSLITRQSYDEFNREAERTIFRGTETLYRLNQTYSTKSLVTRRQIQDGKGEVLRDETFQYDSCDRLLDYHCEGQRRPVDERGHELLNQHFIFDQYDNLAQVSTTFKDGRLNIARYVYSTVDPTQLVQVTNSHCKYPRRVDLEYDRNGCLIRDEQHRILEYDAKNRLRVVRDTEGRQILSEYQYDAAGKLVCQVVLGKRIELHYHEDALIATTGDSQISYISDGVTCWGQTWQKDGNTQTQLWAVDTHDSVLAWVDTQKPDAIHHQQYTPYGFSTAESSIGFNGQWRDPVTGWYHLGNGYRVYNPVLMRFHTPDSWSPFTSGEINPYAYCLGDPINRADPSGHWSSRDWTIMGVGLAVGILVGIFTASAGFAAAVGVSIASGAVTDTATGAIYDAASGKGPTWESFSTDMLFGAIGGGVGESLGRGLVAGVKFASHELTGAIEGLLEGGAKLRVAGGKPVLPSIVEEITSLRGLRRRVRMLESDLHQGKIKFNKLGKGGRQKFEEGLADLKNDISEIMEKRPWKFMDKNIRKTLKTARTDQSLQSALDNYDSFYRFIRFHRLSPPKAAGKAGLTYKPLKGADNQFEVYLNKHDRFTFHLDEGNQILEALQIFGHT